MMMMMIVLVLVLVLLMWEKGRRAGLWDHRRMMVLVVDEGIVGLVGLLLSAVEGVVMVVERVVLHVQHVEHHGGGEIQRGEQLQRTGARR